MVGLKFHSPKKGLLQFLRAEPAESVALAPEAANPVVPRPRAAEDRVDAAAVAEAVRAYEAGATARQVGQGMGLGKTTALRVLRDAGVQIRVRSGLAPSDVVVAGRLYESGLLLREVGERFGVSTECVRTSLLAAGVVMRVGRGGRSSSSR